MTDADRTRLRRLQDRWLAEFAGLLAGHPDDTPITAGGPTVRETRELLLPAWEGWLHGELADRHR